MNVAGSVGFTSKSKLLKTRVAAKAPTKPNPTPTAVKRNASFNTNPSTSLLRAPSATRIPILGAEIRRFPEAEKTSWITLDLCGMTSRARISPAPFTLSAPARLTLSLHFG